MEGRQRVIIENVQPSVDGGKYPAKRIVGDRVDVEADIFADGHDVLGALLRYRAAGDEAWQEVRLRAGVNDRWKGSFVVSSLGRYFFTVHAWVDHFGTWQRDLQKRVEAGQNVELDLETGAILIAQAAKRADGADAEALTGYAALCRGADAPARAAAIAADQDLARLMWRWAERQFPVSAETEFALVVDRAKARYGSWYEMFPRSASPEPGRHGTLRDLAARLDYVAGMGFDTLYLPPIHPIGAGFRKGKNNSVTATADDPGSPWAIGSSDGGHCAIHPDLGTFDDFRFLLRAAASRGIEVAMDLAYQCSPDHPWVTEHPDWFRHRPDGSIQYAENPPKKYQDIYPIDFESEQWRELWNGLKEVVDFWIGQGVKLFRVDNPHTKSFRFWGWMIGAVKEEHPEVLFLAEAFTRPKVMYQLAKLGFTQSYNYFPWRNNKAELTRYLTELTQTEVAEYFRASLWPNTPDILTEYLQYGGRPGFQIRLVLAATLGATYGIYGPAFELCETQPLEFGREEYLNSEKYEIRHWKLDEPWSLSDFIARVNRVRRDNLALHQDRSLRFHAVDNENLVAYSKATEDGSDAVVVVVNLDPHHRQSGWIDLDLATLDVDDNRTYQMHDQLSDARYLWRGRHNYVELDPNVVPAHIFRVRRHARTEREFEYYL